MSRRKKALTAAVCAALLLGLLSPASGAAGGVNLMAVNERVLDTTAENMPRTVGGVLYVPYTMLSNQVINGINLGVSALYSTTRRTVLVTDNQRGVIFDFQNNTAALLDDTPVSARAMVRNGMVFLPIDWLCQYFGTIRCSRVHTPYGTLIRITNSSAILSDTAFADAAGPQLADNLRRYLDSRAEPVPNTPQQPTSQPTSRPIETEAIPATDPPSGAALFLALRPGAAALDCAQVLENRGQRALFLFTEEELAQEGDLIRRLVGAGHTVGLALTGESAEDCLLEAQRCGDLLACAAKCQALIASAPGLGRSGRRELAAQGFVVWTTTVRGGDFSSGEALVQGLRTDRVNYVELPCGVGGGAFLRSALSAMDEENCQLYAATAPALA